MGEARRKKRATGVHDNEIVFALAPADERSVATLLIAVPRGAEQVMRRGLLQNVDLSRVGVPLIFILQGVKDRAAALALLGATDSSPEESARKADWIVLGASRSGKGMEVLVFLIPESAWDGMRRDGMEHGFDLSRNTQSGLPLRARIWAVENDVNGLEDIRRLTEGKAVHELFNEDLAIEEPGYERWRRPPQ